MPVAEPPEFRSTNTSLRHRIRSGRRARAAAGLSPATTGRLNGQPFYADSSLLMYHRDVLGHAEVQMPAAPTWEEAALTCPRALHGLRWRG